jgi:hypothetical protein
MPFMDVGLRKRYCFVSVTSLHHSLSPQPLWTGLISIYQSMLSAIPSFQIIIPDEEYLRHSMHKRLKFTTPIIMSLT